MVEEVVLDQFSMLEIAMMVDEMRSLATTAKNIVFIQMCDCGRVHLGSGCCVVMICGLGFWSVL